MRPGDTLGQYRLADLVGRGGMAAVYIGEHVVVARRVAIKVLHPQHLDNPRVTQRFLNEAHAVAALRHPGIVEFLDFGHADDGRAYIVMELLDGETLAARLNAGRLPVRMAIAFARQMASALAAAHAHGIVHRDLKPTNVFLVPDADVPYGERAKILDFGIAKHQRSDSAGDVTNTGIIVGTPAHMAPEQCRGERSIDGRADVYALGLMLYQMVTGHPAFEAVRTSELLSQQIYEECPVAAMTDPAVPVALSDVIARCVAKEREQRYQSMDEVAAALADVAWELGTSASTSTAAAAAAAAAAGPTNRDATTGEAAPREATTRVLTLRARPGRTRRAAMAIAVILALGIAGAAVTGSAALPKTAGLPGLESSTRPEAEAEPGSEPEPETEPETEPEPEPEPETETETETETATDTDREPDSMAMVERPTTTVAPPPKEQPARREKALQSRRTNAGRARSKPSAPAPVPAPEEDPFAAVATPSVY